MLYNLVARTKETVVVVYTHAHKNNMYVCMCWEVPFRLRELHYRKVFGDVMNQFTMIYSNYHSFT